MLNFKYVNFLLLASLLIPSLVFAGNKACEKKKLNPSPPHETQTTASRLSGDDVRNCNSAWEYYGLQSGKADFEKARLCAEQGRKLKKSATIANAVLMMMYANGEGVERNYDLALQFACEEDPQDQDPLIVAIQKGQTQSSPEAIDYCKIVTSKPAKTLCADLKFKQDEVNQADAFEKTASALSPEVRAKYDALMETADIYFASEAERLNPSDSMDIKERARKIAQSRYDLYQGLLTSMQKLEQTSKLQVSRISLKQVNDLLEHALELYQAAHSQQKSRALLRAQKDWTNYRDAFANYGIIRFQPKNLDMWKAELTRLRALDFASH